MFRPIWPDEDIPMLSVTFMCPVNEILLVDVPQNVQLSRSFNVATSGGFH